MATRSARLKLLSVVRSGALVLVNERGANRSTCAAVSQPPAAAGAVGTVDTRAGRVAVFLTCLPPSASDPLSGGGPLRGRALGIGRLRMKC